MIDKDKLQHFFYGTIIAFIMAVVLKIITPNFQIWLLVLGAVIGFGFELYQKIFNKGVFEVKDAIYTIMPFIMISIIKI